MKIQAIKSFKPMTATSLKADVKDIQAQTFKSAPVQSTMGRDLVSFKGAPRVQDVSDYLVKLIDDDGIVGIQDKLIIKSLEKLKLGKSDIQYIIQKRKNWIAQLSAEEVLANVLHRLKIKDFQNVDPAFIAKKADEAADIGDSFILAKVQSEQLTDTALAPGFVPSDKFNNQVETANNFVNKACERVLGFTETLGKEANDKQYIDFMARIRGVQNKFDEMLEAAFQNK